MRALGFANPASATCYDDSVNEWLIAACQAKSAACTPENIAQKLALPYCPGTCSTSTVPGGKPAVAAAGAPDQTGWWVGVFLVGAIAGAFAWSELVHRREVRSGSSRRLSSGL